MDGNTPPPVDHADSTPDGAPGRTGPGRTEPGATRSADVPRHGRSTAMRLAGVPRHVLMALRMLAGWVRTQLAPATRRASNRGAAGLALAIDRTGRWIRTRLRPLAGPARAIIVRLAPPARVLRTRLAPPARWVAALLGPGLAALGRGTAPLRDRATRALAPVGARLAPARDRARHAAGRISQGYFGGHGKVVAGALAALVALATVGSVTAVALTGPSGGQGHTVAARAALANRDARPERADRADRPAPDASASTSPAAPAPAPPAPKPEWVAPTSNYFISSCFGYRTDPYPESHPGLDFAAPPGTPVVAARAGTVIIAGWNNGGYGNMVVIQHGPQTYTLYGHGQRILASVGQHVEAGDPIMLEGSTGDSTGPHLHFEVWTAMWQQIDPAPFLRSVGVPVDACY